jgi:hypothetical protein
MILERLINSKRQLSISKETYGDIIDAQGRNNNAITEEYIDEVVTGIDCIKVVWTYDTSNNASDISKCCRGRDKNSYEFVSIIIVPDIDRYPIANVLSASACTSWAFGTDLPR